MIARFGRHPHLNEILGRESTPEEIEYLRTTTPASAAFLLSPYAPSCREESFSATRFGAIIMKAAVEVVGNAGVRLQAEYDYPELFWV